MSVKFMDADALKTALVALGYPPEQVQVHAQPVKLRDYMNRLTENLAHVVIDRKYIGTAHNDMGWLVDPKGESAEYICDYARKDVSHCINPQVRAMGGHTKQFSDRLAQEYTAAVTVKHYASRGKRVQRVVEGDKIKLFVSA